MVQGGDGPLLRVQVKSAANMWHGGYTVNNKGSQGPYPENAFDFMAVYVIPLNTWFIVPETVVRGKRGVQVQPRSKRSKYAEYKEAWQLLGGREDVEGTGSRDDAAGPER